MAPERVDTVSEMGYGGSSGTETVREQCCNLEDYPGCTPEGHIKNAIHKRLIEIMHEGAKGDIANLRSRDITSTVRNTFVNGIFLSRLFPFTDCKRKKKVLLTSTYP